MSEEDLPVWAEELLTVLKSEARAYGIDPALIEGYLLEDGSVKVVRDLTRPDPGIPLYVSEAETGDLDAIARKQLSAWREEAGKAHTGGGSVDRQAEMAGLLQIWAEGQLGVPSARLTSEPLMDGGVVLRVARGAEHPFEIRVSGPLLSRHEPNHLLDLLDGGRLKVSHWLTDAKSRGAGIKELDGVGLVVRGEK